MEEMMIWCLVQQHHHQQPKRQQQQQQQCECPSLFTVFLSSSNWFFVFNWETTLKKKFSNKEG